MKYQCDKIRWFKNKFPETKRSTGSQPLNFLAILEIIGVNPRFSFATFSLPHVNKMRCGSGKLLHYSDYLRKSFCSTRGKWNANEMKMVLLGDTPCTGYKKEKNKKQRKTLTSAGVWLCLEKGWLIMDMELAQACTIAPRDAFFGNQRQLQEPAWLLRS